MINQHLGGLMSINKNGVIEVKGDPSNVQVNSSK